MPTFYANTFHLILQLSIFTAAAGKPDQNNPDIYRKEIITSGKSGKWDNKKWVAAFHPSVQPEKRKVGQQKVGGRFPSDFTSGKSGKRDNKSG